MALVLALSPASQPWLLTGEIATEFGGVPIRVLLRIADVVVVGRLNSISEWSEDGRECGRGVIEVSDVIWGPPARGDTLVLEWRQHETPRPRRDKSELMERDWIWLLSATAPGRVRAVSTSCTYWTSPDSRDRMERDLASAPVIVQCDPCRYAKGDTVSVTLGYRNYSAVARDFPGLAFADSILYVDPRVNVTFWLHPGLGIDPRPGHLVESRSLPLLHVGAMSEAGISFDPSAVFPMRGRDFGIRLDVEGYGPPMSRTIHVR